MSLFILVIWVWMLLNGALWVTVLTIEIIARIRIYKSFKTNKNERKKDLH